MIEDIYRRTPLSNTRTRLERDKKLKLAFIGGSITNGTGASDMEKTSWRALTAAWLKERYPDAAITSHNAAIGDSFCKYAIYRLEKDLLANGFDLLFVEFAVNDSPSFSGMPEEETIVYFETLLRRLRAFAPTADIVTVYTICDKYGAEERFFSMAKRQDELAEYYGMPSVNVGRPLIEKMNKDGTAWSDCFEDNVHPTDKGHRFYYETVRTFLETELSKAPTVNEFIRHPLPPQKTKTALWTEFTTLDAKEIDLSASRAWELAEDGRSLHATEKDNELVVQTRGTDISIAAERDHEFYYTVDGQTLKFMRMNRKPYTMLGDLPDGEHLLRIAAPNPDRSRIERIMFNGRKENGS